MPVAIHGWFVFCLVVLESVDFLHDPSTPMGGRDAFTRQEASTPFVSALETRVLVRVD